MRSKNGEDGGTGVYVREGTTSRVTAADRTYGKFYDFYSVSLENFGSTHVYHTIRPDDTAHRGAAVILCSSIRHHELLHYQSDKIQANTTNKTAIPTLTTTHTNWDMFCAYINVHTNLRLRIIECAELNEAAQYFTILFQAAAWHSTPPPPPPPPPTRTTK